MENIKRPFEISQRVLQAHCQSLTSVLSNQSMQKSYFSPCNIDSNEIVKEIIELFIFDKLIKINFNPKI
jgi:hypothetical protein